MKQAMHGRGRKLRLITPSSCCTQAFIPDFYRLPAEPGNEIMAGDGQKFRRQGVFGFLFSQQAMHRNVLNPLHSS